MDYHHRLRFDLKSDPSKSSLYSQGIFCKFDVLLLDQSLFGGFRQPLLLLLGIHHIRQ